MEERQLVELQMNPVTKGIVGAIGTALTALIIGTWATVNNSSIEIVRLQTKLTSLDEKITSSKDVNEEKIKDLGSRTTSIELRINALERQSGSNEKN